MEDDQPVLAAPHQGPFEYDQSGPLDLKLAPFRSHRGVQVHDISFVSPGGDRVIGYLVTPPQSGRRPAILFLHWGFGNRNSFLSEAMAYVRAGAICLLIDAPDMGDRGAGYPTFHRLEVAERYVKRTVIDLRRSVDVLWGRPDVDGKPRGLRALRSTGRAHPEPRALDGP